MWLPFSAAAHLVVGELGDDELRRRHGAAVPLVACPVAGVYCCRGSDHEGAFQPWAMRKSRNSPPTVTWSAVTSYAGRQQLQDQDRLLARVQLLRVKGRDVLLQAVAVDGDLGRLAPVCSRSSPCREFAGHGQAFFTFF